MLPLRYFIFRVCPCTWCWWCQEFYILDLGRLHIKNFENHWLNMLILFYSFVYSISEALYWKRPPLRAANRPYSYSRNCLDFRIFALQIAHDKMFSVNPLHANSCTSINLWKQIWNNKWIKVIPRKKTRLDSVQILSLLLSLNYYQFWFDFRQSAAMLPKYLICQHNTKANIR